MSFNKVDILANIVEFLPELLLFGAEDLFLNGGRAAEIGLDFASSKAAAVKVSNIVELVDLVFRKDTITVVIALQLRNEAEIAIVTQSFRFYAQKFRSLVDGEGLF